MDCAFDYAAFDDNAFDVCEPVGGASGIWLPEHLPLHDDDDILLAWYALEEL